jgi:hypothetical protein
MRVGVLARGEIGQLDWAQRLGFRSIEWVRFDTSLAGPQHVEWNLTQNRSSPKPVRGSAHLRDRRSLRESTRSAPDRLRPGHVSARD